MMLMEIPFVVTILRMLFFFAGWVFQILWVYHDAKDRGIRNPAVWTVVSALLSWIGVLIYLAARKNQPALYHCPQCGKIGEAGQRFCGQCGTEIQPSAAAYEVPNVSRRTRMFFWGFILLSIPAAVLMILDFISTSGYLLDKLHSMIQHIVR